MKKLATIIATVGALAIAAPVFACPHDEAEKADDNAPRTADKDKAKAKAKEADKAKEAPPAKEADKAKPAKPAEKTGDKVSTK